MAKIGGEQVEFVGKLVGLVQDLDGSHASRGCRTTKRLVCATSTRTTSVTGWRISTSGRRPTRFPNPNCLSIIREGEDFYGHAVTVAARVAAQARGSETLVTDLVSGLVAGVDRFEFGPPREEALKGLKGTFVLRPVMAHLE